MKRKVKFAVATTAVLIIFSLLIASQPCKLNAPTRPLVRHMSSLMPVHRDNTAPTANKAAVTEQTTHADTRNNNFLETTVTEIPVLQPTEKGEMDTPSAVATQTVAEPKMGDTRTVDGQKQIYFLGFGWIQDCDEQNVGTYAEDMYQNGNMVGSMGGGTIGESDGDINKMVGRMD